MLKRFVDEENSSSWKTIFDYFLSPVGGKFILKCNFDIRKLPVYLPAFYKECLNAWSSLNVSPVHTYRDVVHKIIWNNKNITVQKLSVFEKHCFSEGIVTVGDLLSDGGVFLKDANVLNANLSPLERFKLMSIVDALPCEWKRIIRQSAQYPPSHIGDAFYLKMEDSEVALSKVSSKLLYVAFKSRKQVPPTAQKKFQEKFPQLQTDWREIYSLPFTVTIETKIREFQYKMLNNIVFTNEKLFRLKMINSPLCTFCKRENESIEHLFFYCDVTMIFWEALCSWLSNYKIGVQPFTLIDILFGVFNIGDDFSIE